MLVDQLVAEYDALREREQQAWRASMDAATVQEAAREAMYASGPYRVYIAADQALSKARIAAAEAVRAREEWERQHPESVTR